MTYRGRQAWHDWQRATSHARLTASRPTMASPGGVGGRLAISARVLSQHLTGLVGAHSGSSNATLNTRIPPVFHPRGEDKHGNVGEGYSPYGNNPRQSVAPFWGQCSNTRPIRATSLELAGAQVPAAFSVPGITDHAQRLPLSGRRVERSRMGHPPPAYLGRSPLFHGGRPAPFAAVAGHKIRSQGDVFRPGLGVQAEKSPCRLRLLSSPVGVGPRKGAQLDHLQYRRVVGFVASVSHVLPAPAAPFPRVQK